LKWAEDHMPVLMSIKKRFGAEKPLDGIQIVACLHVTKETGVRSKDTHGRRGQSRVDSIESAIDSG